MYVALISDLHGNLAALEAVLADLANDWPDQIVCLGDVAAGGPQPHETAMRLRALGCPVVMGNADAWLLEPRLSHPSDEDARHMEEIDLWCAELLSPADRSYLATFQPTVEVPLEGGARLLCFHGSPRSNREVILAATADGDLAAALSDHAATVMAGGHTHVPLLRRWRDVLLVNPGSVGLPFEQSGSGESRQPPWAEYAVIRQGDGHLGVELRRVPIDVGAVVRAALDSRMPHAVWWAGAWSRP